MRFIPRKTNVKLEFFRGVTLIDVIMGLLCAVGLTLIILSNFTFAYIFALSWISFSIMLFVPISDGVRFYITVLLLFKFFAYRKKYSKDPKTKDAKMKDIIPYVGIEEETFISYEDYYAQVLEVKPVEYFLLTEDKQNAFIDSLGKALMRLNYGQKASIVKVNKPLLLDHYIDIEDNKYETVMQMMDKGEISPIEFEARSEVFENRVRMMKYINEDVRMFKDHFYLVVYGINKSELSDTVEGIQKNLANGAMPLQTILLKNKGLAIFLKSNYTRFFDERELEGMPMKEVMDWTMPRSIKFKVGQTTIDDKEYRQFVVSDYPLTVRNAWAYSLFSLPNSKVVVNVDPVGRMESEKRIDKAILEMQTKTLYSAKASRRIENQTHLETLTTLLGNIKNSNETLFDVNIFVTCEAAMKKEVRALLKQQGFKYTEMFGRQVESFVSSNISKLDLIEETTRGIHTSSVAAMFPFISSELMDAGGFYIGLNANGPVFVDFFRRDNERINSNMMIIGKSGSGKSYATKMLLANMAADNSKIFILDPEYEYAILSKNLNGMVIDVGTGSQGRINPFHITPALQSETGETDNDEYSAHLQFLEQYFRVILEGISSDAFEKVNTMVVDVYRQKGIDYTTNIKSLTPDDFPIFDDLYQEILKRIKKEKDEYIRRIYQIIETYIQKFAKGGRNSNLWNGPTTLETKENFVTFSFRTLLANGNMTIANAQMMLVLRYLNNEIIKNKQFNAMMGFTEQDTDKRKVIVAIDEAHVFINKDYPIALNFMETLAKRIRKYDGMQIIITQNIKDFVGSEEIAKQSAAVINASQYSMIFALSPNDMSDLVDLYRNAGGINEDEQDSIATAGRGQAFLITSALSRSSVAIEALDPVRHLFEKMKKD